MRSSVRPVYAAFQMPLAGMEIRGSVPHHIGGLKWSGKTGQRAKMYPTLKTGYRNDEETQFFRQV